MRWPSVSFTVGAMHSVDKGANFVRILFPWASFDAGRDVDAPGMKHADSVGDVGRAEAARDDNGMSFSHRGREGAHLCPIKRFPCPTDGSRVNQDGSQVVWNLPERSPKLALVVRVQ